MLLFEAQLLFLQFRFNVAGLAPGVIFHSFDAIQSKDDSLGLKVSA